LAELQSRIEENERKLTNPDVVTHSFDGPETPARAEAETVEILRRAHEENRARGRVTGSPVLQAIDVIGLSDAVRAQLMAKLPVHLGDTLTPELSERLEKTLRSFDEHMQIDVTGREDGTGVTLRIIAPNSGGFFTLRVK